MTCSICLGDGLIFPPGDSDPSECECVRIARAEKQLALDLADQKEDAKSMLGEWLRIAMDPMTHPDGHPRVFALGRRTGGLWLDDAWADPDYGWPAGVRFVFCLRKCPSDALTPMAIDPLVTLTV